MAKIPGRVHANQDRRERDLILAIADWLWECDADGRVSFLSPEFEASTGVLPLSFVGKRLADVAVDDIVAAEHDEQRAAIAAGKPFRDLVFKLERMDGGGTWVEIAGTPVFDAVGFQGYWGIGKTVSAEIEVNLALQRYRQLFEVASEWFWETDAENRLTYISPNIEAVLGLPPSACCGKRLADTDGVIIDPEAGRTSLAAIKSRQPYRDFIYSRKLSNGKTVWITSSGAPFYGRDGSFLGYRGIARDVTVQLEAERRSRETEQKFRQLFEIAADHYWEVDAQQRVTYISPNYEALTGVSPMELVGKRLDENPNISIAPEIGKMAVLAIKAGQPYRDFVYSYKFADGKKRWISLNGVPVLAADGSVRGYRGVGSNITDRVEAEHAARLAQRRLDEAVSYVTQPIVVYDGENRVVAFNQAFAELHRVPSVNTPVCQGVSFGELVEWQQKVGFHASGPDDETVEPGDLLEVFRNGQEHTYHLWDGRWMLVVYRRLPADGRVGLWTDITAIKRVEAERRVLETQLHHSQRLEALGTLAGGAAHEINNALVPVIALTKLMANKQAEGSRERRNFDMILAGAERSRDLVKQILAFSRKEEEGQPKQSVDVAAVLRAALGLMRATMPTSIRLVEQIAPNPAISGDPSQLQQVIVNIVTNAAQAIGPTHGSITVTLRPEPDGAHLRLSVADTGRGMDEATLARIFEPFFTTKPTGEGTGLGLSMAHGIIKSHGGRIEVKTVPGQGTRFDILLPVAPAEANKAA
jgi:PAS domain S-box-containing protein